LWRFQLLPVFFAFIFACSGPAKSRVEDKPASSPSSEPAQLEAEASTPALTSDASGVRDPLSMQLRSSPDYDPSRLNDSKISVPSEDYEVLYPRAGGDWNVYPADNAVVLQGTVRGPIGDEEEVMVWLTGSVPDVHPDGTTRLEMVVVFTKQENDYMAVPIPSSRDSAEPSDILMGVHSMAVRDTDGDGQTEVVAEVSFRPCCDQNQPDYTEIIVLALKGREVWPSYPADEAVAP
jgi:hypothetical protein